MNLDKTKAYRHKTLGVGYIEEERTALHPHYKELTVTFFRPVHRRPGYAHVLLVDVEALEEVVDEAINGSNPTGTAA